jgi:predicted O-methyltransferase YrrM
MGNPFGKLFPRRAYGLYQAIRYRRYHALKRNANGMLSAKVYKEIYDRISPLPDLDIVEIGGAAGAGSIAIAWAIKESHKSSRLIVVEKCKGGSRSDFGSYDENLQIIQRNFARFGVEEVVLLYPHELTFDSGSAVTSLIGTSQIAGMMLDADGRIDRDFYLFWPLLCPNGLIIVDDYASQAKFQRKTERHPQGGMKSLVIYNLLNQFIDWGLFEPSCKRGATIFGYKPADADFKQFDLQRCEDIIQEIERQRKHYLRAPD